MQINPLVSIIIPTYNSEYYISQTLDSIIFQDYKNLEIIIIDGGSTDSTLDIIDGYSQFISKVISEPDRGISDAFNKGILNSSGTYINFQGSSDLLFASTSITLAMEGINPDVDLLVSCRVKRINNSTPFRDIWTTTDYTTSKFTKYSLLTRMSIPHQGLFTHRKFFEKFGLFDINIKYSMDYEILLRAFNEFPQIIFKSNILSCWREGGIGANEEELVLTEYNKIKIKNRILNIYFLKILNFYIFMKFYIKNIIIK